MLSFWYANSIDKKQQSKYLLLIINNTEPVYLHIKQIINLQNYKNFSDILFCIVDRKTFPIALVQVQALIKHGKESQFPRLWINITKYELCQLNIPKFRSPGQIPTS